MSEVLENGATFDTGRKRLNAFFSATTDAEIAASGVSVNRLLVNTNLSAGTIYSAGTELTEVLNASGAFRQEKTSGSIGVTSYELFRDFHGQSSVTCTLYVTGCVNNFSIDFLEPTADKIFKFQWYNQSVTAIPVGYFSPNAGNIQFNNFDLSAVTETFSIQGQAVGKYNYINDPAGGLTYNGTLLPGLNTSGITATFYPPGGAAATLESGVTRVFVLKGLLM